MTTPKRPNFLIIMADDLGYSDLGCFGGEIASPHLDGLAARGLRMRNFYCAPFCSPSRAMLLTGLDAHLVGFGALREVMDPRQAGKPGYEMHLNDVAPTLSERLRAVGYRTYLSGKWHLGRDVQHGPQARGFDRSYGLIDGSSSHFDQTATGAADPDTMPQATYREDGEAIQLPASGFYSSEAYADKLIAYLRQDAGRDSPFLALLAFTAPHFPLHAPDAYIARYARRYEAGYDAIRRARHARQIELGLAPADAPAWPGHPRWPAWETLPTEIRQLEARNMAVYAAMVECMDFHIGRVLDALRALGQLDDTVILFLSDNGAEGNSVLDTLRTREWVRAKMDNRLDNRGRPGSFIEQGPGWAQVSSTPYRMYKSFTYEGGIRVPCIVAGPGIAGGHRIADGFAHITDVLPTLLDLAGAPLEFSHQGKPAALAQGRSMAACWQGTSAVIHPTDHVTGWEMQGRYALRAGHWKLTHSNRPWGTGAWELHDLAADPGETRDLAATHPDIVSSLLRDWDAYVVTHNVIQAEDMADALAYSNACRYYEDLRHDLPPAGQAS